MGKLTPEEQAEILGEIEISMYESISNFLDVADHLKAENERLKDGLKRIANYIKNGELLQKHELATIAEQALKGDER